MRALTGPYVPRPGRCQTKNREGHGRGRARSLVSVYERLGQILDHEAADTLMEALTFIGREQLARRHDIELLCRDMDVSFAELRAEMATRFDSTGRRASTRSRRSEPCSRWRRWPSGRDCSADPQPAATGLHARRPAWPRIRLGTCDPIAGSNMQHRAWNGRLLARHQVGTIS